MNELTSQYYPFDPPDLNEWEDLVNLCGNPYQSVHFDQIEAIYNNLPVYFICRFKGELVGSIKIYCYESKKLPFPIRAISKSAHVISEPCIHPKYTNKVEEISKSLATCIEHYFLKFKPVAFSFKTSLGLSPLIFNINGREKKYGIAYVDLKKSFEETYAAFSSNARQECRTAIKKNVKVEKTEKLDEALKLFDYARTLPGFSSASNRHLQTYFKALNKNGMCDVWIAWFENKPVSTVWVTKKGKHCFYEYGTSIRTNTGSGYFIHAEIIKHYTTLGFEKYFLGQVAINPMNNPKFEQGITFFKKQFNPIILNGSKNEYIFSPIKSYIWKTMVKLMMKK